jgi:hypothetical protein
MTLSWGKMLRAHFLLHFLLAAGGPGCCITNSHDEVNPPWLKTIDEESMNFNYGSNLAVKIEDNKIKFVKFTDEERNEDSEEFIEVDNMDYCCSGFFVYHLDQANPDYLILDQILHIYIDQDLGLAGILAGGFDLELATKIIRRVDAAEYKRRQYPPGTKISKRAFGKDRRLPITSAWREHN